MNELNNLSSNLFNDSLNLNSITSFKKTGLPIRFNNLSINLNLSSSSSKLNEEEELIETLGSKLLLNNFINLNWIKYKFKLKRLKINNNNNNNKYNNKLVISGIKGIVEQGELLVIISPPTARASLLLRALSSPSDLLINGSLDYGLLPPSVFNSSSKNTTSSTTTTIPSLRSEVIYLGSNDDIFFAHLSLYNYLLPLSLAKTPGANDNRRLKGISRLEYATKKLNEILDNLGLSDVKDTKIGSSTVRGLSGGERRRVAIAEALLSDPSCLMLENPFVGLDSTTAQIVTKYIKKFAVEGKRSVLITSPHLADNLLNTFDKVLVLNSLGQQVYYGRRDQVASYFENLGLGFKRRIIEGEGIAEFVVNCIEGRGNDKELKKAWESSSEKKKLEQEMLSYESRYSYFRCGSPLIASFQNSKSRWTSKSSPYTISFISSVDILVRRQYNLILAEAPTYTTKTIVNLLLSILVGTVFFQLPKTSEGAFSRASLLLLSIMFNAYLSLAELGKALEGREIVKRNSDFGFFPASALAFARVAGDLPLILVQVILFGTITYFLAGLQLSLEKFLIYLIFVYGTALCLSSMFRLFAAFSKNFDTAIRACGVALNILVVYSGFFVPVISMTPWLRWIHYLIDPISRSYEAVLANEFHNLNLTCSPNDIVPYGASYTQSLFQTCTLPGSTPGQLSVLGDSYILIAYNFNYNNIWYNLIIIILQALIFLFISIVGTDYLIFASDSGGNKLIWNRTLKVKERFDRIEKSRFRFDEENEEGRLIEVNEEEEEEEGEGEGEGEEIYEEGVELKIRGSTLTFKDISLWVDTELDTRRLLDKVSGYVKPGMLVALCGVTGSGKSTLLNALAGRSEGVVKGTILVDGKLPTEEFYGSTGYVRQDDLHDDKSTIREALEFSALLRQDSRILREDKLKYVDFVLEVLSLTHLQDAIIGIPTAGINMEQRKRLTIAVEVVSRPTILFCDEPTTGLTTKSAARIVKLLRRLSNLGIAVIATIHQPSAETFAIFDTLLLLKKGGKQIYYGPREKAVEFFTTIPLDAAINPAEFLLDTSSAGTTSDADADDLSVGIEVDSIASRWKLSTEAKLLQSTLVELASASPNPVKSESFVSASITQQCIELTLRVSRNFYRDSSYSYTKFFTAFVVAAIIGFSFFQLGNTIVSFQNRLFSVFLILFLPPVLMNGSIFKIFLLRGLFQAREGPSKIYGKFAFVTSLLLSELPYSFACATIYFSLWYFLVGLPSNIETILFSFVLVQLLFFFISTWSLWITQISSNLGTIANLLPFFLVSCEVFNGALMPYNLMPRLWRIIYWISPFQYYVRAMLGVLLHDIPIQCSTSELVSYFPPPGETCISYSKTYLSSHAGYLVDELSTEICQYCKFSSGDEYLSTLNIDFEGRWKAFFIFLGFCFSNVLLVYLFTFFPPRIPFRSKTTSLAAKVADDVHARELVEGARILESGRGAFE